MGTYEEDRGWADKFIPHQMEIAAKAIRVEVAPIEEDRRRNTDLVLRTVVPLNTPAEGRISARVRRHNYLSRYRDEFTIRLDRPSGIETEMPKMLNGWGDFFIYGFEESQGSDRMYPWLIGNMEMLRDYVKRGGYSVIKDNRDRSSRLRSFHLADMPLGFVLDSDGLTVWDDQRVWEQCRKCWWWKSDGGVVVPTAEPDCDANGAYPKHPPQAEDGTGRYCLACGFWWRSGWVMSVTRSTGKA